ncbi:MAG TPA: HAMP domain-containing sensor histidine kinase, partial [Anaerolineae bacterium]|nr:HAMP domain-containing sensor histidine kinase [Anaerolineae bacterium]
IPAFFAQLGLITAAVAVYGQAESVQALLFGLFSVALVYALVSLPDFTVGWLFPLTFFGALVGKLVMPPLLLHFLLVFPRPRQVLKDWPALLPLIYLPILPTLIYLPTFINRPEVNGSFNQIINGYTAIYAVVGLGLLLEATIRTKTAPTRPQAGVLLAGLVLPSILAVSLNLFLDDPTNRKLIFETLERYGLIGLPIAAVVATVRYQLFDLKRSQRLHRLYLRAIGATLAAYFFIIAFINVTTINLEFIRFEDFNIILLTAVPFFLLRPIYRQIRQRLQQRFYGNIENFRIGLRLFQQELIKVKSRHDVEALVGWNIPADFRLRHAELSSRGRPSSSYALQLPLSANNVSLGTLFFGAKISGEEFTRGERAILGELQKQLSLALWVLELDQAIRTTEELTRLKSKFLANVTHELRAPLNAVINYIGFVVDGDTGPLNPEQMGYLNQALQGAEKLLGLINNILDMSKIEAGQMTLQLYPVNLAELIAETISTVEATLHGKPVQMVRDLAPTLPDLLGDRLRLRQIILNLLSNAAKFTPAGMVGLKVYPNNGNVVIQVADTGQGIKEEILPTIFHQFTTEGLMDRDAYGGSGLSLSITKSLVELHGGHIQVESWVGRGTIFTVTLPVKQMTADH